MQSRTMFAQRSRTLLATLPLCWAASRCHGLPPMVPEEEILNLQVLETWLGGKRVYTRQI